MAPQLKEFTARLLQAQDIDLDEWLADQRAKGLSFNRIAAELHRLTDGVSTVTGQTISVWMSERAAS